MKVKEMTNARNGRSQHPVYHLIEDINEGSVCLLLQEQDMVPESLLRSLGAERWVCGSSLHTQA